LFENQISPEEIGVIIGSSISVSGTTQDKNSAFPSIGNTIQRELDLQNAYVFDLFHTDWCTALDVANMFLLKQQKRYGLVVKGEKFENYQFEISGGEIFPDGISAILFEVNENVQSYASHFSVDKPGFSAAQLTFVTNQDVSNDVVKFNINWNYNDDQRDFLNKELDRVSKENSNNTIIAERWLSPDDELSSITGEHHFLGMHYIPWHIQKLLLLSRGKLTETIQLIAFNPFLLEYTSSIISI
jgi:3-oxoacyl-[acyl-carrier-protein] synthase III